MTALGAVPPPERAATAARPILAPCGRAIVVAFLSVVGTGSPMVAACAASGSSPAAADASPSTCPPAAQMPSVAQIEAARDAARDHGMLWRIRRDGRESYLFGTIHVGKLAWAFPGPTVTRALAASDAIALELDPGDTATTTALRQAAPIVAEPLPDRLQRRLDAQIAAACLPSAAAFREQPPFLQAVGLAVLAVRWIGLDASYAQELVLAGYGRAAGKPVIALETAEAQMAALAPADAREAERQIVDLLDEIDGGGAARSTTRLAADWEAGRLDDLEAYETWCECVRNEADRRQVNRLLDDRNPVLAARIAEEHGRGRRLFAAVGVLHMAGRNGLPALLAQRGFEVERIAYPTP